MQNILIVTLSLRKGGGVEKVCSTTINKLAEAGCRVTVLTFYDFKNNHSTAVKPLSLKEQRSANPFKKIIKLFKRASAISKIIKEKKINAVISFAEDANFPSLAAKTLMAARAFFIASVHSNPYYKSALYRIIMKFLYRRADKVVVVSRGIADILADKVNIPREKLTVVYNAIDVKDIDSQADETINEEFADFFSSHYFKMISVGRLYPVKNHASTIKAFKKITDRFPQARLCIIGDGPEREKLEKLINDLELQNKVHLLGFQANPYAFLSKSDCFIFNSIMEGFGISVVEALSCSLPVISSDCDFGPREILCASEKKNIGNQITGCECGLLVPVNDEKAMEKAMEKIITDKNLRNDLKNRSASRASDFDAKKIVRQWINLIESR